MGDRRLGEDWTWRQRWKNELLFRVATAGLWAARCMSDALRRKCGQQLGRLVSWVWRAGRAQVLHRLSLAFGASAPVSVGDVFEALGQDLADTLSLFSSSVRASDLMPLALEGRVVLNEALRSGRGAIFVTAHLGAIDVMAASVAECGYRVATLARESYDPRFTALYDELRKPRGIRSIYRGRAGAEVTIVRLLREGMLVGFPIDLVGRGMRACSVPFLRDVVPIASGPVVISRRLGVPIVVGSPALTKSGMQVTVEPFDPSLCVGVGEAAVVEGLASVLERRIRALPAHWLWMHRPDSSVLMGERTRDAPLPRSSFCK